MKNKKYKEIDRKVRVKLYKSGKNWVKVLLSNIGILKIFGYSKEVLSIENKTLDLDTNKYKQNYNYVKGIASIGALIGGYILDNNQSYAQDFKNESVEKNLDSELLVNKDTIIIEKNGLLEKDTNIESVNNIKSEYLLDSIYSNVSLSSSESSSISSSLSISSSESLSTSQSLSNSMSISSSESASLSYSSNVIKSENVRNNYNYRSYSGFSFRSAATIDTSNIGENNLTVTQNFATTSLIRKIEGTYNPDTRMMTWSVDVFGKFNVTPTPDLANLGFYVLKNSSLGDI